MLLPMPSMMLIGNMIAQKLLWTSTPEHRIGGELVIMKPPLKPTTSTGNVGRSRPASMRVM